MKKKMVVKSDGRYLIFYAFDEDFPQVQEDAAASPPASGNSVGAGNGPDPAGAGQDSGECGDEFGGTTGPPPSGGEI